MKAKQETRKGWRVYTYKTSGRVDICPAGAKVGEDEIPLFEHDRLLTLEAVVATLCEFDEDLFEMLPDVDPWNPTETAITEAAERFKKNIEAKFAEMARKEAAI